MSRCAHQQSTYKMRKLPKCSRCNNEFVLVCAAYDKTPGFKYEWECLKCHKIVPKETLREEPLLPDDLWLQKWCKENELEGKKQIKYDRKYRTKMVSH